MRQNEVGGDSPTGPAAGGPMDVGDGDLVVVSNRQPYSHGYEGGEITVEAPAGGLTAALDPVMQDVGGTWIAWGDGAADEAVVDENDRVTVPPEDPRYTVQRMWLSEAEVEGYYYGFSNRVLWPACHSALSKIHEEPSYWERYREVNERFVDAVAGRTDGDSIVWFQDYHLALAPAMARERVPEGAVLMHFWHIPWPCWDTFRGCPHARELVEGLLGSDVLGFHVPRYRENFLGCVEAVFEDATVDREAGTVTRGGHRTLVVAYPLGVPAGDIEERARTPEAASYWSSFEERHDLGGTVALGVDRLDYSKGIPERLRALEHLWEEHPDWRGELTYVQNGSESRTGIAAYRDLQEEVETAVERINDRFGTDDWTPVVYFRDHVSQRELASLYRNSDIALVSPIRDGMNLVAQEYVAAQVEDDGVLVLSDQAGAADVLEGAVTVRPTDPCTFAVAIKEALAMSDEERRARMRLLREQVAANDLSAWTSRNLEAAAELGDDGAETAGGLLVGGSK